MSTTDFTPRIIEEAQSRYLAGTPEPWDPVILLLAHHEERAEDRFNRYLKANGKAGSRKRTAAFGTAVGSAAVAAAEGIRRVFGG